jgi:hypothetical protein
MSSKYDRASRRNVHKYLEEFILSDRVTDGRYKTREFLEMFNETLVKSEVSGGNAMARLLLASKYARNVGRCAWEIRKGGFNDE